MPEIVVGNVMILTNIKRASHTCMKTKENVKNLSDVGFIFTKYAIDIKISLNLCTKFAWYSETV